VTSSLRIGPLAITMVVQERSRLAAMRSSMCPYSKVTHGNINVVTNLIDTGAATRV
jgi:organic hydroperoxide reductase OsmC/OhrA